MHPSTYIHGEGGKNVMTSWNFAGTLHPLYVIDGISAA